MSFGTQLLTEFGAAHPHHAISFPSVPRVVMARAAAPIGPFAAAKAVLGKTPRSNRNFRASRTRIRKSHRGYQARRDRTLCSISFLLGDLGVLCTAIIQILRAARKSASRTTDNTDGTDGDGPAYPCNPCDPWFDFQDAGAPAFLWLRLCRVVSSVAGVPSLFAQRANLLVEPRITLMARMGMALSIRAIRAIRGLISRMLACLASCGCGSAALCPLWLACLLSGLAQHVDELLQLLFV